jgi:hypothetical protein
MPLSNQEFEMASNLINLQIKLRLSAIALMAVLFSSFVYPFPVLAEESPATDIPDLPSFSQSVWNGQANQLRGVYVPQLLAMPVVQQPVGSANYVSTMDNVITEFEMAAEVGNVGLLAHNTLAGAKFSGLMEGQEVTLIYGNGHTESFVITRIVKYQALDPYSPYSEFRDLETGVTITATELFQQVYRGERHVTFQTCIEANGNPSWGRMFVIAEPKPAIVADVLNRFAEHTR